MLKHHFGPLLSLWITQASLFLSAWLTGFTVYLSKKWKDCVNWENSWSWPPCLKWGTAGIHYKVNSLINLASILNSLIWHLFFINERLYKLVAIKILLLLNWYKAYWNCWSIRSSIVFGLHSYESANESYSRFSDGMHKPRHNAWTLC